MATFVSDDLEIRVPHWVEDFDSFVEWTHSDEFPEKGHIHFLNGDVWVDISREELFSHNQVKIAFMTTLGRWVKENKLGLLIPDGMRLTNPASKIATLPDGMFISKESWEAKKVITRAGKKRKGEATELRGTPDLVIEVASPSTAEKDYETLFSAYHTAGIPEYWLIDAREPEILFNIYKWGPRGYSPVKKIAGWLKSPIFGKAFRLVRTEIVAGMIDYTLEIR